MKSHNIIDEHYHFVGPLDSSGSKTLSYSSSFEKQNNGNLRKNEESLTLAPPPPAVRLATPLENFYERQRAISRCRLHTKSNKIHLRSSRECVR